MTEHPDRPGYSFNPGPPPEAARFLRNKGLRPSFSWLDVEPEEHAVAFAVAKVAELDLLEAMKAEVQRALDEGLPFAAFQKSWRANPALAGWWGRKAMEDPLTGEVVEAQLGSPRRLRTIYDANLRSARAAGQWERIERTRGAFPYLEYTLGASETHRPHHADKEGLILPVDSPFWDEWMPPNGWGCKCRVRPVTRREAERRGISATPDIPDRKVVNKRTGDVQLVPVGIDPGWQRNPGKLRRQAAEGLLRDRLDGAPEAVVRAALKDVATSWRLERMFAGEATGTVPVAVLPKDLRRALGAEAGVVQLRDDVAAKLRRAHPEVSAATFLDFVGAFESGEAAVERDGGRVSLLFFVPGDKPWMIVVKHLAEQAELWISSAYRTDLRRWRAKLKRADVNRLR